VKATLFQLFHEPFTRPTCPVYTFARHAYISRSYFVCLDLRWIISPPPPPGN